MPSEPHTASPTPRRLVQMWSNPSKTRWRWSKCDCLVSAAPSGQRNPNHSCNFLLKEELCLSPSVVLLSLRCCWTCAAGTQHVASATWRRCSAEVTSSSDYSELNLSVYVLPCYVWVADRSRESLKLLCLDL